MADDRAMELAELIGRIPMTLPHKEWQAQVAGLLRHHFPERILTANASGELHEFGQPSKRERIFLAALTGYIANGYSSVRALEEANAIAEEAVREGK